MMVQFVAFLGAYRNPGDLRPVGGVAHLGDVRAVFVFIFLGAPYVERLRHNTHPASALSGITAALVGVIANLAFYFAAHASSPTPPYGTGSRSTLLVPDPRSGRSSR